MSMLFLPALEIQGFVINCILSKPKVSELGNSESYAFTDGL
jgi:hypothetical protein